MMGGCFKAQQKLNLVVMRFLLCLFLLPVVLLSQNEYNQWRFGYRAGISFNGAVPQVINGAAINTAEAAASVADCDGNLLFYTDGATVYNALDNIMDNGFDLFGESSIYPSNQGALIVKRPNSSGIYYIFTSSDLFGINYSVVNMAAQNGLGSVIAKNIRLDGRPSHKLAVTYHQNNEDIWVLTHFEQSNVFKAFLVTQTGVATTSVESATGPIHTDAHGDLKFNQQGTKVGAVVQDQDLISLADFNNATGRVSNSLGLIGDIASPHGCEFSPDGSMFYVTAWGTVNGGVFQFQVNNASNSNTLRSGIEIGGGFKPAGSPQLAPDGRIYIASDGGLGLVQRALSAINFPNERGVASGFQRNRILLGSGASSWMLPNITLTSNVIDLPKSILGSNFCLSNTTQFSLSNYSSVIDLLWDFGIGENDPNNFSFQREPTIVFPRDGNYTVRLTINKICGSETLSFPVTISSGPETELDSVQICPSTDFTIDNPPVSGVNYVWSPSLALNSSSISNPIIQPNLLAGDTSLYFLSTTDEEGCVFNDTLKVIRTPKFIIDTTSYLCPGFDETLTVPSLAQSGIWNGGALVDFVGLSVTVNPLTTTNYIVEITDTNSCVQVDTFTVTVSSEVPVEAGERDTICIGDSLLIGNDVSPFGTSFQWTDANLVANPNQAVTLAYPVQDGWLFLTASSDTCFSTDSVFIAVNELPIVIIEPSDTNVCFDDTINFTAAGAIDYSWYQNTTVTSFVQSTFEYVTDTTTLIWVEGTDANGCINSDSSIITVLPLPVIEISKDTGICIGKPVNMFVSGGGDYQWLNSEIINSSDSVLTLTPNQSTVYSVIVKGVNSCYNVDSVAVTVNNLPIIKTTPDTLICELTSPIITASGGVDYVWTVVGGDTLAETARTVISPVVPTNYRVVVKDINGCVDSADVSVTLNENPIASFTQIITPICEGFEVQFSDSSSLADSYLWTFGDGTTSNSPSPLHVYDYGEQLNTVLTVGNNNICFDTASISFNWGEIGDVITVFVPNIITPNSDGSNDCFNVTVPEEFEACTNFEIYNRWGMKVYSSTEFQQDFCGLNAYNNQELSAGTYFYVITVGDHIVNGFVAITR